jgi:penicillin amidase
MSASRAVRLGVAVLVLAGGVVVASRRTGPVPALGPFLDPVHGVWAVATSAELPRSDRARIPALHAAVDVRYDRRGVPHIFATTEEDAYLALGYVVARDRLFQMELQARAASGTLSEIVGRVGLDRDREMRRLGLPKAAERGLAALEATPSRFAMARAYADGVNAWIDAMPATALPLEYRLLGRRPARWAPINSLHLLNYMSWLLATNDEELLRARVAARVGRAAAEALFPVHAPLQEPIVPTGRHAIMTDVPIPPPGPPDTVMAGIARDIALADGSARSHAAVLDRDDAGTLGSNNWAVAPRRTASGRALLAGDPHLDLSIPSIWYEAHLVVPGTLDVQGVTIPGAPAIIIGFTRDIAWTFTNVEADVLDHYAEVVDDSTSPTKYRLDGVWHPLTQRIEHYVGPTGKDLAVDTVRYTHRGPLQKVGNGWLSIRWTALDPSPTVDAFLQVAHARSVAEFERAMDLYLVPAQNMLVADRAGSIAIRSTGHFPIRAGDGLGTEIRDGTTSANDWRGFLAPADYPHSVNPSQGFLASTNQEPMDPAASHGRGLPYLGNDWPGGWRAVRINALLLGDSAVTPDAMRRFQTDRGSARADYFVPFFLTAARRADIAHTDTPSMRDAVRRLAAWDRRYAPDDTVGGAALFEAAMSELVDRVWARLEPAPGEPRVATPGSLTLAALMRQPRSPWWDDPRTTGVETRDDVLDASLEAAYDTLARKSGPPGRGGWRWDRVQQANIYHQFRYASLSRIGLPPQGGPHTLSPTSGTGVHGSSWRMVVELGDTIRAWATYPGGQSGNPLSRHYDDGLARWIAGALDSLTTPALPSELPATEAEARLTLEPRR